MIDKKQTRLPLESVEKHETTIYSFYYINGSHVIESETEYHEPEEEEEA